LAAGVGARGDLIRCFGDEQHDTVPQAHCFRGWPALHSRMPSIRVTDVACPVNHNFPICRAANQSIGGTVVRPRAADDFPAIRARMEELRRERPVYWRTTRTAARTAWGPMRSVTGLGQRKGRGCRPNCAGRSCGEGCHRNRPPPPVINSKLREASQFSAAFQIRCCAAAYHS
jgi:hypothetical protein